MTKKTIPAVSIITPMYNAEKYIGECLDSLRAQTFTDFEVIIVDDGSTDNSVAIVEKYIPKLKNRLQLIRLKNNSGGCAAIPRNIAMKIARGEYLLFVDADDAITKTALEEMYTIAKKFNADVISCERFYSINGEIKVNSIDMKKIEPTSYLSNGYELVSPALLNPSLEKRLLALHNYKLIWNFCGKFVRRDLLMEHDIKMVGIGAEDLIFTCCLLCAAPKYILVPNAIYFYRSLEDSLTHKPMTIAGNLQKWVRMSVEGLDYMDAFMDKFQCAPELKYIAFEALMQEFMRTILQVYQLVSAPRLDEFIRSQLATTGSSDIMTSFIFSRMNTFNLRILKQQETIRKQQQQIQELQEQLHQSQKGPVND